LTKAHKISVLLPFTYILTYTQQTP